MRIPIIPETGRHMQSLAAAWRRWSRSRTTTPAALVSPSCRHGEDAALPTVALLVSSTSRNSSYGPPEDYQLLKGCLRSFLNNASGRTEIRLLVAYDQGDRWFEMHHQELQRLCLQQFQEDARGVSVVPQEAVQIRCVDNPSGSNPVYAWNALFQQAHEQGVDYCIQLGDDIDCLTRDWDVKLIQALRRSGNWGLAGGWNGNDDIITQAFVHTASHMRLFGSLYPSSIRNWGSDTWIDHVYRSVPGLRHWLRDDVQMLNGVTASPGLNSNRYQIAPGLGDDAGCGTRGRSRQDRAALCGGALPTGRLRMHHSHPRRSSFAGLVCPQPPALRTGPAVVGRHRRRERGLPALLVRGAT